MSQTDMDDDGLLEQLVIPPQRPLEEEIIARSSGNYEPLPMLDVIFGRMVTAYAPMLKTQTGFLADVTGHRLRYQPWGQTIQGLDENGVAVMVKTSWGGDIAVALDVVYLHAAINSMLGGTPGLPDIPQRAPTTLEKAFALRLINDTLTQLDQHISRIVEVKFTPDAVEGPTQISSFLSGNAMAAVFEMDIMIGLLRGRVSIVLPMQTLEPVRPQLGKMFLGEELGTDRGWRDHFAGQISGSTMTLTAELHRLSVPLVDVLAWRPGVTLDLGIEEDHEATLICSDRPILQGATGRRRNGKLAMRITREAGETRPGGDDDLLVD